MKLTKFFALLFAFSAMTFTFTACGDDEEDINNLEKEIEDNKPSATITKNTPSELELVINRPGMYTEIYNAKFDNEGFATEATISLVYSNEDLAKKTYEDLRKDDPTVKLNGKTVIIDITEAYEGLFHDDVLLIFDDLKNTAF